MFIFSVIGAIQIRDDDDDDDDGDGADDDDSDDDDEVIPKSLQIIRR